MASIQFAAPLIRSAISSLQAGMAAQVALFNAEAANTVDLVVPQTYHFGATDTLSAFAFPQVEVAVIEGQLAGWSLQQHDADHLPRVTVAIWTECLTGLIPTAYEESLGLGRCAIELLCRDGAFGTSAVLARGEAVTWRTDCLPADLTSPDRTIEKWRVPFFATFPLETIEIFQ